MEQKNEEERLEEEGKREDEDATEYGFPNGRAGALARTFESVRKSTQEYEYPTRNEYDESIL